MSLYYVHDAETATADLAYAWDGEKPHVRPCTGPDGERGAVLSVGDLAEVGYYPDRQTWREMVTRPGSWIGYDQRPGPGDLARSKIIPGYRVPIEGEEWTIPMAMRWDESAGPRARGHLPVARQIDRETGQIVRVVREQHQRLLLMADEVWDACEAGAEIDLDRAWEICVAALQTNYRVGPEEVDLLQLLGDTETTLVLWGLVDYGGWRATANGEGA